MLATPLRSRPATVSTPGMVAGAPTWMFPPTRLPAAATITTSFCSAYRNAASQLCGHSGAVLPSEILMTRAPVVHGPADRGGNLVLVALAARVGRTQPGGHGQDLGLRGDTHDPVGADAGPGRRAGAGAGTGSGRLVSAAGQHRRDERAVFGLGSDALLAVSGPRAGDVRSPGQHALEVRVFAVHAAVDHGDLDVGALRDVPGFGDAGFGEPVFLVPGGVRVGRRGQRQSSRGAAPGQGQGHQRGGGPAVPGCCSGHSGPIGGMAAGAAVGGGCLRRRWWPALPGWALRW